MRSFLPLLLGLALAPAFAADDDIDLQVKRFVDVYSLVEANSADPVTPDAIWAGALPGMLRRLDPHSVFFDPGQFQQLKEMEDSTRKGFGSVVSVLPGRVIVLQTLPNTPSARSGISPGDEILAINNIPLNRLEFEQLIQVLTESRQKPAKLDVRRPGNARLLQFVMTPESMDAPSVDRTFLLKPDIGYLRVTSFDAKTGKDIGDAIEKLGGAKLKGLVLDLRNNPGGFLPPALETAAMFLKPAQKLLSVRGRKAKAEDVDVPKEVQPYTFPLAVLINEKSASGSEIVAGALQDHDRATVVGGPSFGKGLVQSVYPLSQATGLALTTAFYYTPSGRSIQKQLPGQIAEAIGQTAERKGEFKTDSGRAVQGGGGIQPDIVVGPPGQSRLEVVIEASGSLTNFATEIARRGGVTPQFEVTNALLDEFKVWLSERNIRPPVGDWSRDQDWIRHRLKQEIFNQSLGVAKGDEVEAQNDPVVKEALRSIGVN